MSLAINSFKSALQSGSLQVTRAMLQEQMARIDRIHKEQELIRFTGEQNDRLSLLDRILCIENVYLRIMLRSFE